MEYLFLDCSTTLNEFRNFGITRFCPCRTFCDYPIFLSDSFNKSKGIELICTLLIQKLHAKRQSYRKNSHVSREILGLYTSL
jgi:hypothetical protein